MPGQDPHTITTTPFWLDRDYRQRVLQCVQELISEGKLDRAEELSRSFRRLESSGTLLRKYLRTESPSDDPKISEGPVSERHLRNVFNVAKGKIANEVAYRANIEGRIITFSGWLDTFALFLPTRVANEEIGDALEDIKRRVVRGCPPWHVWAKVVSTIIWASLHAIATVWSPGGGKKGAGQ